MKLKLLFSSLITALLLTLSVTLLAAPASNDELQQQVKKVLQKFGVKDASFSISDRSINGMREVMLGQEVFYISDDGKNVMIGTLYAVDEGMRDLTEQAVGKIRKPLLDVISDEEMIIYGDDNAKHSLIVFTDVNCGYCKRFHDKIDDLTEHGIRIKYLFLPVITQTSYASAESVWCSADRNQALTDSKAGKAVAAANCDTPIDKHMLVARQLGLQSTPSMFLDDGRKLSINWTTMTGAEIAKTLDAMGGE